MDIVFFSICGGTDQTSVDFQYNMLMGSMIHHAKMGRHVVLDNSPVNSHKKFTNLPPTVTWVYEPIYGHGAPQLRQIDALRRASGIARDMKPDAIVYTDCDEFWSPNLIPMLEREIKDSMLNIPTIHVDINGDHYYFPHEYHRRAWSGKLDVTFPYNNAPDSAFQNTTFEGNRQRHAIACPHPNMTMKKVEDICHHHMKCMIWGGGSWSLGTKIEKPVWPEALKLWKEKGIQPHLAFL